MFVNLSRMLGANRGTWRMKLRWTILIGVVAVGGVGGYFLLRPDDSATKAAAETRLALRREGFKTDLSEFNFSASVEQRIREAALTNAAFVHRMTRTQEDYARQQLVSDGSASTLTTVGTNAAVVVWKTEPARQFQSSLTWTGSYWAALREGFTDFDPELDAACATALSGVVRLDFDASHGSGMLLPQLPGMKSLAASLANRALLELHDQNRAAAWTNLMAVTRLTTAWDAQPVDIVQLVRCACALIAFNATWQALQAGDWTDAQLAELQREWATADFFSGLAETAAFRRACAVDMCQRRREEPLDTLGSLGITWREAFLSPRIVWYSYRGYRQQIAYRNRGSFEDEKALLLHFRDRELELRRALRCTTWLEMSQLPGITNLIPFQSKHSSSVSSMLNMRQLMLATQMYNTQGFQGRSQGFMSRIAETEVRRRLILTALALERHRLRHGAYPKTLEQLDAALLSPVPLDFVDGKPLRYQVTDGSRFVLYSVGLDGNDDGGRMPNRGLGTLSYKGGRPFRAPQETDLVWPRPASDAEIAAKAADDREAERRHAEEVQQAEEERKREATAARVALLAQLETLAARKLPPRASEPKYQGRVLSDWLRNTRALGTNLLSLDELLTLRQITTGAEPDVSTFELPIRYDVVTNLGELRLLVDAPQEEGEHGEGGEMQEFKRAANGNCRLVWTTLYDPPGKHFLQAGLFIEPDKVKEQLEIRGPLVPFISTNLIQLDSFVIYGENAFLQAWLVESNGNYKIEIQDPQGEVVKTLTGTTSNSVIEVNWDLVDDRRRAFTNESFNYRFHITLPDSGRSQLVR